MEGDLVLGKVSPQAGGGDAPGPLPITFMCALKSFVKIW